MLFDAGGVNCTRRNKNERQRKEKAFDDDYKTDDDAYELYIIQRATSFNSRTRTTAQHDVVLRFYRVGICELEERASRRPSRRRSTTR